MRKAAGIAVVAATIFSIPVAGHAGGFDKFLKTVNDTAQQISDQPGKTPAATIDSPATSQTTPAPEAAETIPALCLSDVCIGDDPAKFEQRLDTADVSAAGARTSDGEEQDDIAGFLKTWAANTSTPDPAPIVQHHPEAVLNAKDTTYGKPGGILAIAAKTAYGTYRDIVPYLGLCQPIVVHGTVDDHKVAFIAMSDPARQALRIIGVSTFYQNIPDAQADDAVHKYREKFGPYSEARSGSHPVDQLVYIIRRDSLLRVAMIHPALMDIGSARTGQEISGQFGNAGKIDQTSVTRSIFSNRNFLLVYPDRNVIRSFLARPECAGITKKLSTVDIR